MVKVKKFSWGAKWKILIPVIVILLAAAGGMLLYKSISSDKSPKPQDAFAAWEDMGFEQESVSSYVTATGVTSIGMISEAFPVEGLTDGLEIEEVLIEAGDMVGNDTSVIKFTEDSVKAAREELEAVLREADLAYRSGKIEYEQSVISAEYSYQNTLLNGKYAEEVYAENIANLEENVEKAKDAYEEVQAEIAAYQADLAAGTYAANVEKWQTAFDANYKLLEDTMNTWGFTWPEVTGGGRGQGWGATERDQYLKAAQNMYSALEINEKYLLEAEEEYEEKVTNGSFYLQTLQLSLPELDEAYAAAQANYETSLVQAKLTRETSLTEAELAKKNYETSLEKAETELETLKEAYEDAEENLQIFEKQAGTGYYYPTESGTVMRVSARAGRTLTSGSTVFTIRDTEEMTVTVYVDQADIAEIGVGDSAIVYSEDSGMAQGVVKSINPVSGSSARNSVTYSVIVEITDGMSAFDSNESVYVYFMTGGSNEKA